MGRRHLHHQTLELTHALLCRHRLRQLLRILRARVPARPQTHARRGIEQQRRLRGCPLQRSQTTWNQSRHPLLQTRRPIPRQQHRRLLQQLRTLRRPHGTRHDHHRTRVARLLPLLHRRSLRPPPRHGPLHPQTMGRTHPPHHHAARRHARKHRNSAHQNPGQNGLALRQTLPRLPPLLPHRHRKQTAQSPQPLPHRRSVGHRSPLRRQTPGTRRDQRPRPRRQKPRMGTTSPPTKKASAAAAASPA